MKASSTTLASLGGALAVTGVLLASLVALALGVLVLVVGVFMLMVALVDWSAVEAEVKDTFRFRFTRDSVAPERAAEIRILSLVETGGNESDVDFRAEVVNEGTRFARVGVSAEVDGHGVRCEPAQLDLPPNQSPARTRILVPRPQLGDLVHAFNKETTLYGRTLTLSLRSGDEEIASETWQEHIYTEEEDSERHTLQQREWRIGRGESTPSDDEADMRAMAWRRIQERQDEL